MINTSTTSRVALITLAFIGLVGAAPPVESTPQVYAYTPNLVLDFGRDVEVYGQGGRATLTDCSLGALKCVSADYVKVAWKQECILQKGDVTTVGDIRSEVLETYIEQQHLAASQVSIVVTTGMPDTAYLIREGGLVGVIVDHTRSGRLRNLIDDGTVGRALEAGQIRPEFGLVNRLLTLDPLGNCRVQPAEV